MEEPLGLKQTISNSIFKQVFYFWKQVSAQNYVQCPVVGINIKFEKFSAWFVLSPFPLPELLRRVKREIWRSRLNTENIYTRLPT